MIHFWRVRKDGAISGPMWSDQAIRKKARSSGPGVPWSGLARRRGSVRHGSWIFGSPLAIQVTSVC